jgi:hypothetical protein
MLPIGIHYLSAFGSNIDALNLLHRNDAEIMLFLLKPTTESLT